MVSHLFFLFIYIVEAFFAYMYFTDNYEKKLKAGFSILASCALYFIGFIVNLVDNNNVLINLATILIINVVYALISVDITFKSAVFHSSILLALMFLTETFIQSIFSFTLKVQIDAYRNDFTILIIVGIISKVLYLMVSKLISILFSYKNNKISKEVKKNSALFLYPLIITIMLALFLYTSTIYDFSEQINILYAIVSIASLVFCCMIFIINQKIQKQEADLMTLQTEAQKNETNKTFYELLEKKNEDQRVLAHDIRHHFSVIQSMQNIDEVKQYLSKIQSEYDEYKFIGKSKNKMLDLILSKYSHICETNNIKLSADIRSSNLKFIADNDLTSLLSNLFDNAVDAAKDADDAFIRFTTRKDKNFVVLSVVNSSPSAPKSKGEKLITTKKDKTLHGYGMKSIEKSAKKYGGICHWEYNEDDKSFHFNIIFNDIDISD